MGVDDLFLASVSYNPSVKKHTKRSSYTHSLAEDPSKLLSYTSIFFHQWTLHLRFLTVLLMNHATVR